MRCLRLGGSTSPHHLERGREKKTGGPFRRDHGFETWSRSISRKGKEGRGRPPQRHPPPSRHDGGAACLKEGGGKEKEKRGRGSLPISHMRCPSSRAAAKKEKKEKGTRRQTHLILEPRADTLERKKEKRGGGEEKGERPSGSSVELISGADLDQKGGNGISSPPPDLARTWGEFRHDD